MLIRPEQPQDHHAIDALIRETLGKAEAQLVVQLRAGGEVALALVAEDDDAICGHILFSPMEAPFRALGLAPLCVAPSRQRRGIGGALVREGLAVAAKQGWVAVFVLGDPDYYRRFGFSVEAAAGFDCQYAGPHFMVHDLGRPLPVKRGRVEYAKAFEGL